MIRKRIAPTLSVLLALTFLFATVSAHALLEKGAKALDFELPSLDDKKLKLSELQKDPRKKGRRRVVLLSFWATWCPPCRKEVPHLQKLHKKYDKKGLVVVGVSVDSKGAKVVQPFVEKYKLTYTQLLDEKQTVCATYKARYLPTTYIIDRRGAISSVRVGFAPGTEKKVEKEIEALLK